MTRKFLHLILYLALLLSHACATPYYGYSEAQWNALSDEEKVKAKAEYDEIIKANRDREQTDLILEQKHKIIERGLEPY